MYTCLQARQPRASRGKAVLRRETSSATRPLSELRPVGCVSGLEPTWNIMASYGMCRFDAAALCCTK